MKNAITLFIFFLVATTHAQTNPVLVNQNVANYELYPSSIAYYNGEVYFPDFLGNRIIKTSANTTNAPVDVVLSNLMLPIAIHVIGDELYFLQAITTANPTNNSGKLSKIDLTQATPTVVDVITGLNVPIALSGNSSEIFFAEVIGTFTSNDIDDFDIDSTRFSKVNLSGTPTKTVILTDRNYIYDFKWDNSFLYWIEEFDSSDQILKYATSGTSTPPEVIYTFDDNMNDEFATSIYIYNDKLLYASSEFSGGVDFGRIKSIDLSDAPIVSEVSTPFTFGSNDVYPSAMTLHDNELFVSASSYNFNTDDERELLYKVDVSTLSVETPTSPDLAIRFYPNPMTHELHIDSEQVIKQVEIFTVTGQRISTIENPKQQPINVSGLAKGLYLVKVNTENGVFTKKLTKQ